MRGMIKVGHSMRRSRRGMSEGKSQSDVGLEDQKWVNRDGMS